MRVAKTKASEAYRKLGSILGAWKSSRKLIISCTHLLVGNSVF